MYDITIQNAVIIDGTGLPAYRADIAIKGDRIAAIGKLDAKAKQTIKARGRTVIPGIIDPHSHADLILPLAPKRQAELMRCKLAQGVTTTVIGNCGLGCAPVANGEAEGILRAVNAWMTPEPVDWKWRTVGEYLDRIESNGLVMNIATLAPARRESFQARRAAQAHARAARPCSYFGDGAGERRAVEIPDEKDASDGRAGHEGRRSGAFDRFDLSAGDVFGH